MPRLPVTPCLRLLAALALLAAPLAQAAVIVRKASELSDDRQVVKLKHLGTALSGATVIYDRCPEEYDVTPQKKEALLALFHKTADAYLKAYHDAYVKRVGYLPDGKTVEGYTRIVNNNYQKAADNMAQVIAGRRGCHTDSVKDMIRFINELETANQPKPPESDDE